MTGEFNNSVGTHHPYQAGDSPFSCGRVAQVAQGGCLCGSRPWSRILLHDVRVQCIRYPARVVASAPLTLGHELNARYRFPIYAFIVS